MATILYNPDPDPFSKIRIQIYYTTLDIILEKLLIDAVFGEVIYIFEIYVKICVFWYP
jgi:hypothetical protein